jgi:ATP-binding cassette subfamily B protein
MTAEKLYPFTWPAARLGEAVEQLALKSRLLPQTAEIPSPPAVLVETMNQSDQAGYEATQRWLEASAGHLGLEVEAVETPYGEVSRLIGQAAPAILRLPGDGPAQSPPRFLVLLRSRCWWVTLLTPGGSLRRVKPELIRSVLCEPLEQPLTGPINQLLNETEIPPERWDRVRAAIWREQLNAARLGGCWLLRQLPQTEAWTQATQAKLPRYLLTFWVVHLVQYLLFLLSWWFVGRGALIGHFEPVWLVGWGLLLITIIPFQLWANWLQSLLALGAGTLLKRRLLFGALQLQPEEVRHQGAGQFLGRVLNSEAVELLALGGGFAAIVAMLELVIAMGVLAQGAGGLIHSLLLFLWVSLALILGWQSYRQGQSWLKSHLTMTDDLVERMVGHRTRLAQESPAQWHELEDQLLAQYLKQSAQQDKLSVRMSGLVSRGWLIVGLAGLAAVLWAAPSSVGALAITAGGILLGSQALGTLAGGMSSLTGALLAWQQVERLYQAAGRAGADGSMNALRLADATRRDHGQPLLAVRDVIFRYSERSQPILKECSLAIFQGDRLLLEGPSGSGKSTFASLLIGLRQPQSGLLLLHGLDQPSVGLAAWRQRVVAAPQFHENYVLTGTLAFNLLLGRRWPPQAEDVVEAETICRELGLGEVIDRMPAGMQQMVGEGGWQLSHGERSRLYMARALLQPADLVVLDESFAALDPENLRLALECVLRRAPTLLVIAHP